MKIRTPLNAAHPGTRISEGCLGHCMQYELHKETRKKRNQITVETKLCTFVARLFLSQEGFYPHALPCMQRFLASQHFKAQNARKHNVHGNPWRSNSQACSDRWRNVWKMMSPIGLATHSGSKLIPLLSFLGRVSTCS